MTLSILALDEREAPSPSIYLDRIFRARSVALIGASANAKSPGGLALQVLQKTGFPGEIFLVTPKYAEIDNRRCYPDVDSLPVAPDAALIIVRAEHVPEAVAALGRKGTHAAVVLSTGFEESETGKPLAAELAAAAKLHSVAVVGPNCQGTWSVKDKVMLTFGGGAQRRNELLYAPIAVVSQSGAFSGAIGNHLQDSGLGCSYIVSSGNETVLGVLDYLEWFIEQDDVKVVVLHIEGLQNGARLLRIMDRARARGVDVVALKTGNSVAGQKAAASHTGKIASPYAIYRDILDQAGVVQVRTLTELLEICEIFITLKSPIDRGNGGGVSVASNSGGACSLISDLFEEHDVPLAAITPGTMAQMASVLPSYGNAGNPADFATDGLKVYEECVTLMARDPATEALVFQLSSGGQRIVGTNGDIMKDVVRRFPMPAILSFSGDRLKPEDRRGFLDAGILDARDPGETARYMGWLYRRREIAQRAPRAASLKGVERKLPVSWSAAAEFLAECEIGTPAWRETRESTAIITDGLRFPVAVKALPEDAEHKTELGLVILGLRTPDEVIHAANSVRSRLGNPEAPVLVQEMVRGGVEVVMSVIRTPEFGPILAIGSGGVAVELYGDVAYLALPADADDVLRALRRLKLWRLLQGFRGQPKADVDALVRAAVKFSANVAASPEIGEFELNPIFVLRDGEGLMAVELVGQIFGLT